MDSPGDFRRAWLREHPGQPVPEPDDETDVTGA